MLIHNLDNSLIREAVSCGPAGNMNGATDWKLMKAQMVMWSLWNRTFGWVLWTRWNIYCTVIYFTRTYSIVSNWTSFHCCMCCKNVMVAILHVCIYLVNAEWCNVGHRTRLWSLWPFGTYAFTPRRDAMLSPMMEMVRLILAWMQHQWHSKKAGG